MIQIYNFLHIVITSVIIEKRTADSIANLNLIDILCFRFVNYIPNHVFFSSIIFWRLHFVVCILVHIVFFKNCKQNQIGLVFQKQPIVRKSEYYVVHRIQ